MEIGVSGCARLQWARIWMNSELGFFISRSQENPSNFTTLKVQYRTSSGSRLFRLLLINRFAPSMCRPVQVPIDLGCKSYPQDRHLSLQAPTAAAAAASHADCSCRSYPTKDGSCGHSLTTVFRRLAAARFCSIYMHAF